MKSMQQWFDEYGESHQNPTNKLIHWICVPAIFFSIIALLSAVPLPIPEGVLPASAAYFAHLGTVVIALGLVFYLRISFRMFLGMLIVCLATLAVVWIVEQAIPLPIWQVALTVFVLAWIGQFYGHKVEGKKPSFFEDLQYLMIGPAWLLGFIYRKLGLRY